VQLVTRDTHPVPTGERALMFVPSLLLDMGEVGCKAWPRVTLRLVVPNGATRLKAKVRDAVLRGHEHWGVPRWLGALARPGSAVVAIDPQSIASDDKVLDPQEQTDKLPGSDRYTYGKLRQWSLPLPSGTANEVLVDFTWECPSAAGTILDDLQVE
jgi:hypothetical protein